MTEGSKRAEQSGGGFRDKAHISQTNWFDPNEIRGEVNGVTITRNRESGDSEGSVSIAGKDFSASSAVKYSKFRTPVDLTSSGFQPVPGYLSGIGRDARSTSQPGRLCSN
jgi:hypothetical protein